MQPWGDQQEAQKDHEATMLWAGKHKIDYQGDHKHPVHVKSTMFH